MNKKHLSAILMATIVMGTLYSCQPTGGDKAGITREPFGVLPNGDSVMRYTLTNSQGIQVKVLNYGGIIQSLMVPDKDGQMGDVVLGFDSLDQYLSSSPYFGAIVGRYGNRIAGGTFTLDDSTYHLFINNGPNSLHGGKVGFDKVLWNVTPVEGDSTQALELSYLSRDGEEGYPGNLQVKVTYTLDNQGALRIDYHATTDKKTVLNLTNHSYFNLNDGKGTVLDHVLTIHADRFVPVDSTLIPTGVLQPVDGTPMDLRQPTAIGAHINDSFPQLLLANGGFDHCWVLNTAGSLDEPAIRVEDPANGRVMEVFTTEPGVQFYSGNFLDGSLTGSHGNVYPKHGALALETEHFPDSPNQPSFPSTVLEPGATYRSTTIYQFSVKK